MDAALHEKLPQSMHDRIVAVRMVHNLGFSTASAAQSIDVTQRSVENWLVRFEVDGVEGLRDAPKIGAPRIVSWSKIKRSILKLRSRNELTPANLAREISRKYKYRYTVPHAYKLLRLFGYTCKTATAKLARAAPSRDVKRWQKRTKKWILRMRKRGIPILIQDESIFINDVRLYRKEWSLRGERICVTSSGEHERIVVYGAIGEDTSLYRLYSKFNAETFVKFLEELRRKYGKFALILDNATQHGAIEVQEYIAEHRGEVILHYMPVARPELSAIEEVWRQTKRAIMTGHHETFEDMCYALSEYLRTTRFGLDIFKYLERLI